MKEILKLDHIQKFYGNEGNVTKAIQDIDFSVQEGEFLGIMGASGSGKTTMLNCISTIDTVSAGHIYLDGTDVTEIKEKAMAKFRRENLGFIFQDFYLMDSLSVEENIILPMIIGNIEMHNMHELARKYAEQFQISHILKKNPYELSGGEKQRVAICRALINNPDLILADEPTGNLDSKSGKIVIDALNRISTEYHKTIVMVTHDPQMASYCDRIILLKDGKILDEIEKNKSNGDFYSRILSKMVEL